MHQRYFVPQPAYRWLRFNLFMALVAALLPPVSQERPDYWSTAMSSPILGHTGGAWRSFAAQNIHRRHMLKELFTDELI